MNNTNSTEKKQRTKRPNHKIERQSKFIELLSSGEWVSTKQLQEQLKTAPSSFAEDKKELEARNFKFETKTIKRKTMIRLLKKEDNIFPGCKMGDIQDWLILYILQKKPLDLQTLVLTYVEAAGFFIDSKPEVHSLNNIADLQNYIDEQIPDSGLSLHTIYNRLERLVSDGYVKKSKVLFGAKHGSRYEKTSKVSSSYMIPEADLDAYTFNCLSYPNAKILPEQYESVLKKANILLGAYDLEPNLDSDQSIYGKLNTISNKDKKILYQLMNINYRAYSTWITWQSNNTTSETRKLLSIGLVYYNNDNGNTYLLVKGEHPFVIPFRNIISLEETNDPNTFPQEEADEIYEDIFASAYSEPEDVRIRFKNYRYVADRLKLLTDNRKNAVVTLTDNNELVYEDRVRGISDLSRFLRSFPPVYIVESPLSLKEKMTNSAQSLKEKYEEVLYGKKSI